MNDEVAFFDQAVRQLGRQRLPEDFFLPGKFGLTLDQIKSTASLRIAAFMERKDLIRSPLPTIFDYTDGYFLEAFAFNYEKHGVIAMSGAGAVVIHSAMFRLLSRPDVLKEIGNPNDECSDLPFLPLSVDVRDVIRELLAAGKKLSSYLPRNITREMTAHVMAALALDFVFAHEFRHIQAGHVEYWSKVSGQTSLKEINNPETDPSLAMKSQALEMDADAYGIFSVLHRALRIASHPDDYAQGWRLAVPDDQTAVFLSLISAYTVFKLFDLVDDCSRDWLARSHPPPAMRSHMLMSTAHACFTRWNRMDLVDWLVANAPKIFKFGEWEISATVNVTRNSDNLRRVYGQEGLTHVSNILKTWATIEKDISPFSAFSFQGLSGATEKETTGT